MPTPHRRDGQAPAGSPSSFRMVLEEPLVSAFHTEEEQIRVGGEEGGSMNPFLLLEKQKVESSRIRAQGASGHSLARSTRLVAFGQVSSDRVGFPAGLPSLNMMRLGDERPSTKKKVPFLEAQSARLGLLASRCEELPDRTTQGHSLSYIHVPRDSLGGFREFAKTLATEVSREVAVNNPYVQALRRRRGELGAALETRILEEQLTLEQRLGCREEAVAQLHCTTPRDERDSGWSVPELPWSSWRTALFGCCSSNSNTILEDRAEMLPAAAAASLPASLQGMEHVRAYACAHLNDDEPLVQA